ncbi:hypothetical protein [Kitasatospora kifunensis]|uniref:Transcriptional regulator n=1 Tax=Kitasatospora kifunensis TaxID=58351 RepID=A0A7W7VT34_KITKI|nr:hypothetical protein [Kitasatospora kifunensis]
MGISHGLASHHLRQLGKYGFVRQVEGVDNRERPWQLQHTSLSADGIEDQPGGAEALAVLEQLVAERAVAELNGWQQRRASWPPTWRRHSGVTTNSIYLTEAELAELTETFDALLARYLEQRPIDDLASRPPGSRAVNLTLIVTPQDPTAAES